MAAACRFHPHSYKASCLTKGKAQKGPEQRGLFEIDETTAVTDDDPHRLPAVLSNRIPPRAEGFAAVPQPC